MAYYLRFQRMRHGLTQAEVSKIIGCSNAQVSKYESGEKQLDANQCKALDLAWDTGGVFATMLVFAKQGLDVNFQARRRRYQHRAIEHQIFSQLIPIPFQIEEYARGLLEVGRANGHIQDVDEAVTQRMEVQSKILENEPQLWILIDQIALRPMGSHEIMAAQRDRLLEVGTLNHVSIRVLPLSAAPHIGVDGPFWCFTMPDRRLAALSGSALAVGRIIDDQIEAARAVQRFQRLAAQAWNEEQSLECIARMGEDHDGLA
ncbi:helix-turn-helix domain-containing protein [Actinomadura rugatobispora]|uniref:Helix-turn-helix transcriptional regulator n=1 Tax=Actinomadura rugatobispora TaxID=1994 RepID=A0ABW1AIC8_9ACTN